MDFSAKGLKNLVSDVTTVFTRAKQFAEETIGTSERTELDPQYETLAENADNYKQWTERIVSKLEAVIQPNPNMRYGEMLIEKMGTEIKRDRLRNLEYLGNDMIDAGIAFGPTAYYGSTLMKVGKAQQCLGQAEKDFVLNSYQTLIIPFRKFLEEDMKTIAKERKVLETKRLDLDIAKNRYRKAKCLDAQLNAQADLKIAQEEFDRQIEITKLLLEGINSAQSNHVRCLNDFVTSQIEYYHQSYKHMCSLQQELSKPATSRLEIGSPPNPASTSAAVNCQTPEANISNHSDPLFDGSEESCFPPPLAEGKRRARCLNNYDAQNSEELSLRSNEIIVVYIDDSCRDTDWMIGERGKEKGKVPVAYLEILN